MEPEKHELDVLDTLPRVRSSELKIGETRLGVGRHHIVHRATWNDREVALRILHYADAEEQSKSEARALLEIQENGILNQISESLNNSNSEQTITFEVPQVLAVLEDDEGGYAGVVQTFLEDADNSFGDIYPEELYNSGEAYSYSLILSRWQEISSQDSPEKILEILEKYKYDDEIIYGPKVKELQELEPPLKNEVDEIRRKLGEIRTSKIELHRSYTSPEIEACRKEVEQLEDKLKNRTPGIRADSKVVDGLIVLNTRIEDLRAKMSAVDPKMKTLEDDERKLLDKIAPLEEKSLSLEPLRRRLWEYYDFKDFSSRIKDEIASGKTIKDVVKEFEKEVGDYKTQFADMELGERIFIFAEEIWKEGYHVDLEGSSNMKAKITEEDGTRKVIIRLFDLNYSSFFNSQFGH